MYFNSYKRELKMNLFILNNYKCNSYMYHIIYDTFMSIVLLTIKCITSPTRGPKNGVS